MVVTGWIEPYTDEIRVWVFETLTGREVMEIFPESCTWSCRANDAEEIEVGIDLNSTDAEGLNWRTLAEPWKRSLALRVGGRFFGGPIMPHKFDDDGARLSVSARGLLQLLSRRYVLPPSALAGDLAPGGKPNPAYNSTFTGDLGTIAKKIVQQAMSWPGSSFPIIFPPDRSGPNSRTYQASERVKALDALTDITKLDRGVDIRFQLQRDASGLGFEWVFETGTQSQPRLQSSTVVQVDANQASGITVEIDPSKIGSLCWSTGGRSSDTTIIRQTYRPDLVSRGFPLLELESDASDTASNLGTLDAWNLEALRVGQKPWEFWGFKISRHEPPLLSSFNIGDLVDVHVTDPVSGNYIPQGQYTMRIVGVSGSFDDWVTLTLGGVYG